MKIKRHTEEQIIAILKEHEAGMKTADLCRKSSVVASRRAVPQVAAPSVEQSSENLIPHSVPTIAYRLLPPGAQTVSRPTAVAARTVEPMPAGASKSNVVLAVRRPKEEGDWVSLVMTILGVPINFAPASC
jgi:hypothetical protein